MSLQYDVFISYSSADKVRVMPWAKKLREGGLNPFVDSQCLVGGADWQKEIVDAIDSARLVFFIASRTSFNSEYTKKELAIAEKRKKTIVPIYIENAEARGAFEFMLIQAHAIFGYDRPVDDIWSDILKALARVELEWKPPVAPTPPPVPTPPPIVLVQPPVVAVAERRYVREPLDLGSDLPRIEGPDEPAAIATPTPRKATRSLNERRATQPLAPATTSVEPSERAESPTPDLIAKETPTAITEAMDQAEKIAATPSKPRVDNAVARQKKKAQERNTNLPARPKRKLVLALSTGAVSCAMMLLSLPFFKPNQEVTIRPASDETLTAAGERLTREYYAAPKAGRYQTELMASKLDLYIDKKNVEKTKIREELDSDKNKYPIRDYAIQGAPRLDSIDQGKQEVAHVATIRYALANDAMTLTGLLTGRVTVSKREGKFCIIKVEELGERKNAETRYSATTRSNRALTLIDTLFAYRKGDTAKTPKTLESLFSTSVAFRGTDARAKDIAEQFSDELTSQPIHNYVFDEAPKVISNPPSGVISVAARFIYRHRSGEEQPTETVDLVDGVYDVTLNAKGTPTITGIQETVQSSEIVAVKAQPEVR